MVGTVELAIYPSMTNIVELDTPVQKGEIVLLRTGKSVRQIVVQCDYDVLTPKQLKENWPDVRKATLK
eukprot:11176407-Lingulodinium_polyedra.AAC.1